MKIHNRVKALREEKKLSQEYIAHELGLNQSQYSRRENGEVKFMAQEVFNLSKLLDTPVGDLFGDEVMIFQNTHQKGGVFGQFVQIPEKVLELYEARLKEKDKTIQLLEEKIMALEEKRTKS